MFSSVGLKFDKVSPRADHTYILVITIVPVETLIGVSPVVRPYTFELVGVSPLTLPYTLVSIFCTRLHQKTPTKNILKYACLQHHTIYSTISYHKKPS